MIAITRKNDLSISGDNWIIWKSISIFEESNFYDGSDDESDDTNDVPVLLPFIYGLCLCSVKQNLV